MYHRLRTSVSRHGEEEENEEIHGALGETSKEITKAGFDGS